MPIPREFLTFWFCIFIAGPTLAADYWISIGSFKDRGAAEQGLIDARKRSSQNIAVVAQPSEDGIRYRVSAGPFTTKNEAQSALTRIKEDGFGGAWVWQLKEYVGGDAYSSLLNTSEEYVGLADMIFLSVNTPTKVKGIGSGQASDLKWIEKCTREIAKYARGYTIVVEKSTLPVKTAQNNSPNNKKMLVL